MKKVLLIVTLTVLTITATAGEVTVKKALQKARAFMSQKESDMQLVAQDKSKQPAWYVFAPAKKNSGFVIMAGDDRVSQVLGYTDEGSFDPDNMPENMEWWLKGCTEQIQWLREGKASARRAPEGRQAVAPMLTTKWGQDGPYNLRTPVINSYHAPTGCMPTALAQILYYWKSTAGAKALDAYTTYTNGINMPALPATTFDYNLMQDEYDADATDASAQEVAKLMLYCGQAFKVDYQELESGASGGSNVFVNNFYFDIHGRDLKRIAESQEEWDATLYAEMKAGRPIFMSAINYQAGHGFVIDGYDGNGLYHINWGWNGRDNGFYVLDVACPSREGHVALQGEGYTIGQVAGLELRPASDAISHNDMALSVQSLELDAASYTRSSSEEDFTVNATAYVQNDYGSTLSFNNTVGVFTTDGQFLKAGTISTVSDLQNMYGGKWTRTISFGSGLNDGTYILKMVSRLVGEEKWNEDFGSYRHYAELTISGNSMTANVVTNPFNRSLTINSMEVIGNAWQGAEVTLKFNATNTGTYYINNVYAHINNVLQSAIGLSLEPGETGDFYLHYTPTSSGNQTVNLRSSKYNGSGTSYLTSSFTVAAKPDALTANVTSAGWATFVPAFNVTVPEGVEAYYVSAASDVSATLTQITDKICAKEPVLLKNEGTHSFPVTSAYVAKLDDNLLKVSDGAQGVNDYVLANHGTVGFYKWIGAALESGKVYLPASAIASGAPEFISILNDNVTGISTTLMNNERVNSEVYNLNGQRVTQPTKGLYIVNGKKVVLK